MKSPLSFLAAILIAPLLLSSCDLMPPKQRRVAFDEAAFAPYGGTGSGVVTGRATGLFFGTVQVYHPDTIRVANHLTVKLMPDNAYTEEIEQQTFRRLHPLLPPDPPRFSKYVREATSDGDGNFTFSHVPPGSYYVTCRFTWPDTFPIYIGDDVTPTGQRLALAEQTLYSKISVAPGQTVRVGNWQTSAWFALAVDAP